MNKYLIEILKIQNSVILPGLGALMVPSQKSGKIVFNPHLKFNDGSLARFIAEKEGIDAQEAQNKTAKFVREIEAEIGKGNSYDMFEFGRFFKNKDGEIDFEMASGQTSSEESAETKNEKLAKPKVVTPADILSQEKKETEKASDKIKKEEKPKKTPAKATIKKTEKVEKTDKVEKAEEDKAKTDKQSKNKFIPPVAEDIKEKAKKVEGKVEEKIEKPVEKVEKKIEKKVEKIKEKVEETKEKIIPPVIAESKKDDKPSEDKQSKNKFVPPVKEEAKKEATDKKDNTVIPVATAATGAAIATGINAAKGSEKSTTKVVEKTTSTTIIKETVKEEKKKRSKLPWLILLLLLIGLGVAGFFFKDEIMAYFDKGDANELAVADSSDTSQNNADHANTDDDNNADTEDLTAVDDSTAMNEEGVNEDGTMENGEENGTPDATDPVVEDPIDEEPIVEEAPPVVSGSNNGSYHLIGNSFGEEANAERYVSKMKDKGYPAKVLGRFDGLYLVSLKSYDSRDAAQSGRSSVTADASSAWIFKYPK